MPEWLSGAVSADGDIAADKLAVRLVLSAVLGGAVACVYALTRKKTRSEAAPFSATLVLLTVLIALVTQVIGNSVARAFSLVGALSIVRFRTVVDDTRDTSFVIFAVAVGMAVGSGFPALALVGIPVVGLTAAVLAMWGGTGAVAHPAKLVVRLPNGTDPQPVLAAAFDKHLREAKFQAADAAKQGSAVDYTYLVRPKAGVAPVTLIGELSRVEGVQSVEWREPS
ncbi:DUF4956 domain-containing protein [Urbifossiella limnaea]|uniref:DUF4956 domain-containing protein n=1 Tax=Urbifossiella limnaea TaxID=2528023 RepID=A0A517XPQ8_9BACT|nr:DUF4956 domain-containing protein [Urbifossiella limnaea]QDU19483.1 hypothetical protein ETAA1_14090 [Urbifossiella limnaea]